MKSFDDLLLFTGFEFLTTHSRLTKWRWSIGKQYRVEICGDIIYDRLRFLNGKKMFIFKSWKWKKIVLFCLPFFVNFSRWNVTKCFPCFMEEEKNSTFFKNLFFFFFCLFRIFYSEHEICSNPGRQILLDINEWWHFHDFKFYIIFLRENCYEMKVARYNQM